MIQRKAETDTRDDRPLAQAVHNVRHARRAIGHRDYIMARYHLGLARVWLRKGRKVMHRAALRPWWMAAEASALRFVRVLQVQRYIDEAEMVIPRHSATTNNQGATT